MGAIYKRGSKYWIKYYRDGVPYRESSGSDKETVAKNLLKLREGDVARGVPVTPQVNRCKIDELFEAVVSDYKVQKRRSLDTVERRLRLHLLPYFGGSKAAAISADHVRRFIEHRQEAGAANGEINRELAILKRAYSLGIESHKVMVRPKIPHLTEDNVRTGFFEREQFEAVRKALPEDLRPVVTFAYQTGWRIKSEVLSLQWRQVDFSARTVRLEVGTTKNREGRLFPFTAELGAVLDAQRARTRAVERERGIVCPWVFHRSGEPIRYFRRSWLTACRNAGTPAKVPHDFRRTAVRNLVRAGVPEAVAMKLTGHKTRAVFERYNVVSRGDLFDAAEKLERAAL